MSKNKIEALLQLLADYDAFCNTSNDVTSKASAYSCELSEDELELVAAAAQVPPQKTNKPDNT